MTARLYHLLLTKEAKIVKLIFVKSINLCFTFFTLLPEIMKQEIKVRTWVKVAKLQQRTPSFTHTILFHCVFTPPTQSFLSLWTEQL